MTAVPCLSAGKVALMSDDNRPTVVDQPRTPSGIFEPGAHRLQVELGTPVAARIVAVDGDGEAAVDQLLDRIVGRRLDQWRPAFAWPASTLPGSDSLTFTSRAPHFGQRMRLDSIETGKARPRGHSMVRTSSRTGCRRRGPTLALHGEASRNGRRAARSIALAADCPLVRSP
jgi:hypothetical protein